MRAIKREVSESVKLFFDAEMYADTLAAAVAQICTPWCIDKVSASVQWTCKSAHDLSRAEVEQNFAEDTWQRTAYNSYIEVLLDQDRVFPCIYAAKGYKANEQLFFFIDTDDLSEERHAEALAAALDVYLPKSRSLGPNTSLVLLARQNPDPLTMEEYLDGFWKLLNNLALLDRQAWPEAVPRDIDTDKWCLCYGGEPFFTVIQVRSLTQNISVRD
jgi:FPC/CPF motif-containing protein YcgG